MSIEKGKTLIQKRQFKNALLILNKLLMDKPEDLRANFLIGKIYYELNDITKCIIYFKKCNEIQPNNPNILFNMALAFQNMGKIDEAKKNYLKLISINSRDIKSYYGLLTLDANNITREFYYKLQTLNKDENVSILEKSLINFIFSKLEREKNNIEHEIKYLEISHKQSYESNLLINKLLSRKSTLDFSLFSFMSFEGMLHICESYLMPTAVSESSKV